MWISKNYREISILFCGIIIICSSCIKCRQKYQDVEVGNGINFFVVGGHQDVFVDSLGNHTILNYQPYECMWPEHYNESDPGCLYTRSQWCVQEVEVISGEMILQHKLAATGWGSWFVFPQYQFAAVNDSPNSNNFSQIENIVIQNTTYSGVTQFEVSDTASAIEFIQYTKQNKILRVRMDDGTVWERTP